MRCSRRSLITAFAALAGARAAAAGTVSGEPAPLPAAALGVYGDSLGDGVWGGLYGLLRRQPQVVLFRRARIGAGLTRPDYAEWLEELPKQIAEDGVTVAVVMLGTNDQQGLRDERRKGYRFGSETWKSVYAARIDAVLEVFRSQEVRTFWMGLPVMRSDELNAGAEMLNALYAAGAAKAGATFLPTIDDFKGPDGQFAAHIADRAQRPRLVRAEDGIHFTPYGYELIAAKVVAELRGAPGRAAGATGR